MLGAVGYNFSIHTVRWIACGAAVGTALYLTWYGLTFPAQKPGSLSDAFTHGADTLSSALMGHRVPVPGRIGWLVIVVVIVLGYRGLEAWTLHRQAPFLDVSTLTTDQQDSAADAGAPAQTGKQRHDWLVAELTFRLPSVQVRSPAILPGGSRPAELASIAEASGVNGAGMAAAIIRFFGMIWPNPPRIQVRAWVERTPGHTGVDDVTRVTVGLADQRSGASIATKTLIAGSLDDAAAAVAGYVARHIFARDRTVPAWSGSATDGTDLAALLRARQVRGYPERSSAIRDAWTKQIEILEGAARGNLCAGVVRYELAQLYDLTGRHAEALLLHAVNREQYPRFYRGRYRLAMSLEMLANPDVELDDKDMTTVNDALQILDRCSGEVHQASSPDPPQPPEPPRLLDAARQELLALQRYLSRRRIIWGAFWHRDERAVLRPYWRPRHRQGFQDGVRVALLLVAVREAQDGVKTKHKLGRVGTLARIAAAISGDSEDFGRALPGFPRRKAGSQPMTARLRTRRKPWQCSTPSWTAAYNLACVYAALMARRDKETSTDALVTKLISSLKFAICNPECELEHPSEWISNDPDFRSLHHTGNKRFADFLDDQKDRDYPDEGSAARAGNRVVSQPGPGRRRRPHGITRRHH
jgi:hypothetical protein